MKATPTLLLAVLLAGCATKPQPSSPPQPQKILNNQAPMYGGVDRRTNPQLAAEDQLFIQDTVNHFGDRKTAAAKFVENGFGFYSQNNLVQAMRRFNQAWLLDSDNPEVYWGFAAVLRNRESACDALPMLDMAIARKANATPINAGTQKANALDALGFYPDAARIVNQCAVQDDKLSPPQKKALLNKTDALFREGERGGFGRPYLYESWARAYHFRGDYANAWKMVANMRAAGGQPDSRFIAALQAKMPEPSANR